MQESRTAVAQEARLSRAGQILQIGFQELDSLAGEEGISISGKFSGTAFAARRLFRRPTC